MIEMIKGTTKRRVSARRIPTAKCPKCGERAVPIQWGYPTPDMMAAAERGELALGGCCVKLDGTDARWRCGKCGEEWR